MKNASLPLTLLLLLGALALRAADTAPPPASLPVADLQRAAPVDFEKEVLPFLKTSCLACHNTTKAKGGLNLETPQFILKGGDTGPAAVPGQSAESLIFKAAAHLDRELIMPPKDNKANAPNLKPDQLALLKLWLDQGAKGEVRAAAPIAWLEQPPSLDPILAVALTADGQFAACGRGSRIDVYHVPSRQLVAQLTDPKLTASGFTNVAHRDLVNALAFSPDGQLLASAGYREVKLWRHPHAARRTMLSASNDLEVLALSPDRQWLAIAGADHAIALWDLARGQQTRLLTGLTNAVAQCRFSPDSRQLVAASKDKAIHIWGVAAGAVATVLGTPAEVLAVAWLADGKQVAVGGQDGLIRVLELASGTNGPVQELKGHTSAITALEAIAGGSELLSGSADGMLRRWHIAEAKTVVAFTNGSPVLALAARPDGQRFASAGTNSVAKLWNAADGKLVAELKGDRYAYELVAETARALTVAKSDVEFRKKAIDASEAENKKQSERLAKASETNSATAKIQAEKQKGLDDARAAKGKAEKDLNELLAQITKTTEAFEAADKGAKAAATTAKAVATRAADRRLAAERALMAKEDVEKVAADAATVAARSKAATSNDLPPEAKAAAQRVAEDAAGVAQKTKSLAEAVTADAQAKSRMADEARAAAEKAIEEVAASSFAAGQLKPGYDKTLAEAPGQRKAATNQIESTTKSLAGAETEFKKAETRHGVTQHELELATPAAQRASNVLAAARSAFATAETAQKKIEASLEAGRQAATAMELPIRTLAFSPDNRTLATAGDDPRLHTWSADTGAAFDVIPREPATGGGRVRPPLAAFLDAHTVLALESGQRIVASELNSAWTLERTIGSGDVDSPLVDRINAVDFSPDGRTLATAGGEPTRSGEVKLWDIGDGKLLHSFTNVHSDAVLSLDFSPDGKFIASAAADRFVRVVELATGKVAKAFEGHTSYVLGVAWKRDSRTLASAGADKVIKVWDFVTGERKKNIEGAEKEVTAISFVGATGEAVAASGDSQVRLMRENGDKVRSFEGAGEFMNAVAVTPDGLTVIAGGQDGTMHLWNGTNGVKVASFGPAR